MSQYNVTGMMCAACSARVERAVKTVEGVELCSVNLLTNTLTVEGSATEKDIIAAVEKAGYGIKISSDEKEPEDKSKGDSETRKILVRLVSSLILVVIGAINWGLVGIFEFNLVTAIFGDMTNNKYRCSRKYKRNR